MIYRTVMLLLIQCYIFLLFIKLIYFLLFISTLNDRLIDETKDTKSKYNIETNQITYSVSIFYTHTKEKNTSAWKACIFWYIAVV